MTDIREQLRAMPSSLNDALRTMEDAAQEIERLQEAKRRALAIADERAKEACHLRAQLASARKALEPFALDVGAVSLGKALGHITREHLLAAKAALTTGQDK